MGRGRGKGKKLTVSTSHDDPESGGEEVLPTYKRRGRPQKPFKDDVDEEDYGKIEEEEEEEEEEENYGRTLISSKDNKTVDENGKKRIRHSQMKGGYNTILEENSSGAKSSNTDESARSNGFRPNGSRRKSKPRRAAEAGVDCE